MSDNTRAVLEANLSGLTIVTEQLDKQLEAKAKNDEDAIEPPEEPIG